jgi:MFS family permease
MTAPKPPTAASPAVNVSGRQRLTFVLLAGAVFIEAVGIGALYPLLAKIQAAHHLPTYGLGLMSGASFFAALVTQLVVARLLDGRRARWVLLAGLTLSAVAPLWFSQAHSLWALSASRAVGGVGYGIMMPAALRAGSVGVPADRRGARLGLLSSAQMAGIVAGPLGGVALYELGGLGTPFEVVATASAVILVAVVLTPGVGVVPASDDAKPAGSAAGRPRATALPVVAVLLLAVSAQLPTGFYDALWSRLLTDRGASTLLIGLSLTLFGIPFTVLAPTGGRLAGRSPLIWAGVAVIVSDAFMASYGVISVPVVIVILGVFEACAQSVAVPAGYAATAAVFPEQWAATGQGWFSGAGTAAAGTAATLAAPAYQAFGPGPVFATGAAVSAASAMVALALRRRARDQGAGTVTRPS